VESGEERKYQIRRREFVEKRARLQVDIIKCVGIKGGGGSQ